ncbi:limbic system-associated membrane protein [Lepeophtheirus salmonis]|nr:zwei Ig domain protein zig-8-like [Lepeophtheirus salmonis]
MGLLHIMMLFVILAVEMMFFQRVGSTPQRHSNDERPHFHLFRIENYTVQSGATAHLPCVIKNLGNRSVAWIRSSDSHILTVDEETFISDPRFTTIHQKESSTWTLQIKLVGPEQAGQYECQISTEPKLSHFVYLTVIVPKVSIYGDRDVYVKSGSSVFLKCVIAQSLIEPTYIEWRFGDMIIEGRGRIHTTPPEHLAPGTTMSTLSIATVERSDSGPYTCIPSMLNNASVNLHVFESDFPAAMQTSEGSKSVIFSQCLLFMSSTYLHLIIFLT